jgi:hypothetical protein
MLVKLFLVVSLVSYEIQYRSKEKAENHQKLCVMDRYNNLCPEILS